MIRFRPDPGSQPRPIGPFPFPAPPRAAAPAVTTRGLIPGFGAGPLTLTRPMRRPLDRTSRRIDDLARQFGCLGHFSDQDDDRPRAA